jgi:hypothetical protein
LRVEDECCTFSLSSLLVVIVVALVLVGSGFLDEEEDGAVGRLA